MKNDVGTGELHLRVTRGLASRGAALLCAAWVLLPAWCVPASDGASFSPTIAPENRVESARETAGSSAENPLVPKIAALADGDGLSFERIVVGSEEEKRILSFLSYQEKYVASLGKRYIVTGYRIVQNSKGRIVLVANLENPWGWGEEAFFDVTEIMRLSRFSEEEARKRMQNYLVRIADQSVASRGSVPGSLDSPFGALVFESLDRTDEQMKAFILEREKESEITGEGFKMRKNTWGETVHLKLFTARNARGQTKTIYFELPADVYHRLRWRLPAAPVAEGDDRPGKTLENPLFIQREAGPAGLAKTLSLYAAQRDPAYRFTGFCLAPRNGPRRILSTYLENAEGWGEVAYFDVQEIVGALAHTGSSADAVLCSALSKLVETAPPPDRVGSENRPIVLKEVSDAKLMVEEQQAGIRELAGACRLVGSAKLLKPKGNEDRYLEVLTVEDEQGRINHFWFDMNAVYSRLQLEDTKSILDLIEKYRAPGESSIIERTPEQRDLSDEIVFNSFPNLVVQKFESLHDELLQEADKYRDGFRIQGFSLLFEETSVKQAASSERAVDLPAAMHLQNNDGWKRIRFIELSRVIRGRRDPSLGTIRRALNQILECTPPFDTPYADSYRNPVRVGTVASVVALEKQLHLAFDAQYPGCRLLPGARYLVDQRGRYVEAVTVVNDRMLRKSVFFDLTDAYGALEKSEDLATRRKVVEWKARHRPCREPARPQTCVQGASAGVRPPSGSGTRPADGWFLHCSTEITRAR